MSYLACRIMDLPPNDTVLFSPTALREILSSIYTFNYSYWIIKVLVVLKNKTMLIQTSF